MDILVFGGTAEGRELALWLVQKGWKVCLSVATEYGARLVGDEGISISAQRRTAPEMARLMRSRPFCCAVDATHPYAVEVTENIRLAAAETGLRCLRLLRGSARQEHCLTVKTIAEAAERLKSMPGNIFLTTGSKELEPFAVPGLKERCFLRVLPTEEALRHCLSLGFSPAQLVCMQGPFSRELNAAMLRQLDITVMVTKESGRRGGFPEKAAAAEEVGCTLLVVERPQEESGFTMEEIKNKLLEMTP